METLKGTSSSNAVFIFLQQLKINVMTQEENLKQLLLKDLCARLPYGVKVQYKGNVYDLKEMHKDGRTYLGSYNSIYGDWHCSLEFEDYLKPYLRPMSSMKKEEREEVEILLFPDWFDSDSCKVDGEGYIEILANYDVSGIEPGFCSDYVDWLNAHHFDYRFPGLIGKGLALEASKGIYNIKEH